MKILYLGYYIDDKIITTIEQDNPEISIASNKFERTFLSKVVGGSAQNVECTVLSANGLGGKRCLPSSSAYKSGKVHYFWYQRHRIGSFLHAVRQARKSIDQWIVENRNEDAVVLTYAINPVLVLPLMLSTRRRHIKVATICSEVPQMRVIDGIRLVGKMKYSLLQFLNERMDAYVFLSEHMNDVCNRHNKPWIVVEALPDVEDVDVSLVEHAGTEYIFYAGGLTRENGIECLIEAYSQLNTDIQLWICGRGALEGYVAQAAQKNPSIRYLGSVTNQEAQRMEREASFVINPRLPSGILTRYSFPSKTVEYMLSGTPTVITRLDGIPKEYFDYSYELNANSVEEMRKSLDEVIRIPVAERIEMGKRARRFILEEKSAKQQVNKIMSFLETLM